MPITSVHIGSRARKIKKMRLCIIHGASASVLMAIDDVRKRRIGKREEK